MSALPVRARIAYKQGVVKREYLGARQSFAQRGNQE